MSKLSHPTSWPRPWQAFAPAIFAAALGCDQAPDGRGVETTSRATYGQTNPGDPFPGLSPEQLALFVQGGVAFDRELTIAGGLGPVFTERSCVACHAQGGKGGADPLTDPNHFVERFGTINGDGTYNNLAALGGDVRQTQSISAEVPTCGVPGEVVPPTATIVARRNPLPMFGAGLIAAIPDATILAGAVDKGDGVHGRANLDATGAPGRFGWKAQTNTLPAFNAGAANGTMGWTSPLSPNEQAPQGQPLPNGCTNVNLGASSPNDPTGADLLAITAWEVLLAPVPALPLHGEARRGSALFAEIGCEKCHTASMQTGDFLLPLVGGGTMHVEVVSQKSAALYSDLLLHDMGPEMDEGVVMRQARGSEFRTAPLWGLRLRTRFLHDARAQTLHEAIVAHGGEATTIRDRYLALSGHERRAIRRFLARL